MVHQKTLFCSLAIGFVAVTSVMPSLHAQAQSLPAVHDRNDMPGVGTCVGLK
jgi:hypothetical protein